MSRRCSLLSALAVVSAHNTSSAAAASARCGFRALVRRTADVEDLHDELSVSVPTVPAVGTGASPRQLRTANGAKPDAATRAAETALDQRLQHLKANRVGWPGDRPGDWKMD